MNVCKQLDGLDQDTEIKVRKKSTFREYAESIAIALIIALFIRTFIVQPFKIPSGSMEQTLEIGDHILVSKFIYGIKVPFSDQRILKLRDPKRGDIVVFAYPKDMSKDFIKRVIGTPGDVVEIRNKNVFVNGKLYLSRHEQFKERDVLHVGESPRDNLGPIRVPDNSYFVMGDNRDRSYDSRFWGFVGDKNIKGLALVKYWSWDGDRFDVRWRNLGRLVE